MIKIGHYEYGTVEDLAKAFGCTRATIYRWVSQGKLPRGGSSPRGMIWRMDRLSDALSKDQASVKTFKLCVSNLS